MAAEYKVFGDNNAAEFRGISQIAPRNLAKFAARGKTSALSVTIFLGHPV